MKTLTAREVQAESKRVMRIMDEHYRKTGKSFKDVCDSIKPVWGRLEPPEKRRP